MIPADLAGGSAPSKPRRRTRSGGTPRRGRPGEKPKPTGPQESNSEFENLHARDERGVFTAGPDRNRGPKADEPSVGASGPKVSGLQGLLNELGYTDPSNGEKLKVDGSMGPTTVAALVRAQRNLGVTGEDGFLGPKTRAALRAELDLITPTEKPSGGSSGGSRRRTTKPKKPAPKKPKTDTDKPASGSSGSSGSGSTLADRTQGVRNGRDTGDQADTYLDQAPGRGKWGTPWPPEWGKEPPATNGEARRIRGYSDGSARYEDGTVWDPDTGKFRKFDADDGTVRKGPGNTTRRRSRSRSRTSGSGRASSKPTEQENETALERLYRLYGVKGHPMVLERKALHGGGTKVLDAEQGIVEAIISVTGIVDEVKDVILPGAYAKTLATRKPKGVNHHAWETPVAKALEIRELLPGDPGLPHTTARGEPWPRQAGAVIVKAQFNLDTQRGREAYSDVEFYGDEQEWSIGYDVPRNGARIDSKTGQRHIHTISLFEFSPVLFGAMPLAGSLAGTKSLVVANLDSEAKALAGSYEARREAVTDAARMVLCEKDDDGDYKGWVDVRGTFPDRVVACVYGAGQPSQDYEIPYTMDGDDNVTLGTPVPVKVTEVVEPDPDAAQADAEYPTEHKDEAMGVGVLSAAEILASENLRQYV